MDISSTNAFAGLPDADLAAAIRAGHGETPGAGDAEGTGDAAEAIAVLYARHYAAAVRTAGARLEDPSRAEDVAVDAFADLLELIRQGSECGDALRAWLACLASRKAFAANRHDPLPRAADGVALFEPGDRDADPVMEQRESGLFVEAFKALPARWQEVLWRLEIENAPPAEVAEELGLGVDAGGVDAVAAVAGEAREGLRASYLEAHGAAASSEFAEQCHRLGEHLDGSLGPRAVLKFEEHLDSCPRCDAALAEVGDISTGLLTVIAPLFLGAGATSLLPLLDGSAPAAQESAAQETVQGDAPALAVPETALPAADAVAASDATPTAAVSIVGGPLDLPAGGSPSGAGPTVVALSDLAGKDGAASDAAPKEPAPKEAAPTGPAATSASGATTFEVALSGPPSAAAQKGSSDPSAPKHSPGPATQSFPALRVDADGARPRPAAGRRKPRRVGIRRRLLPSVALAGTTGVLVAGVAFAANGTLPLPLPSGATGVVSEVVPMSTVEGPSLHSTQSTGGSETTPSSSSDAAESPASEAAETPAAPATDGTGSGADTGAGNGAGSGAAATPSDGGTQSTPGSRAPAATAPKTGNPAPSSPSSPKTGQPSADVPAVLPDPTQPGNSGAKPAEGGAPAGGGSTGGAGGAGGTGGAGGAGGSAPLPVPETTVEVSDHDAGQSSFSRTRDFLPKHRHFSRFRDVQLELDEVP